MKKIALLPVIGLLTAFLLVGGIALAQTGDDTDEVDNLSDFVALIINHYDDGMTPEEIVDELDDDYADLFESPDEDSDDDDVDEESDDDEIAEKVKKINFGQFKKTLRNGSAGDDVLALQESLNEWADDLGLTFPDLTLDGKYGPRTAQAVRLFQTHQRIGVDGVVGEQTLERLKAFFDRIDDSEDEDEDDDDSDDEDEDDSDNDDNDEDDSDE